jgi:hypothetical protein
MPAHKRPVAGRARSDGSDRSNGTDGKNFGATTPPTPSRAPSASRDLAPRFNPQGDIPSGHPRDTPPGPDDPRSSDNPFDPPLENQARPTFYYNDYLIRIPMDIDLNFIPQDNTAFLQLVETLRSTLRKAIQADPTFPDGKHDSEIECEFRLESFILYMLEQDPAHHTPRWETFGAVTTTPGGPTPGGSRYYPLWFARRLVDFLEVNRRRRRRGLRAPRVAAKAR